VDQLQPEIQRFMNMLQEAYKTLGLTEYTIFLSTRPEKRMGSDEVWDKAEGALKTALENLNLPYKINAGDGAFYGPKLDIMFVDAIKRPWQLGTLQLDFNMPMAFKLGYVGEDNKEHIPVMLHRAILGSLERFIGVYLEHTAAHLPTWLSPSQVAILTVSDRQLAYGREVESQLKAVGLRAWLDERGEKLGYKIREAQGKKTPYMLVLGDKEAEQKTVSVRLNNGQMVNHLSLDSFIESVTKEVRERRLENLVQAGELA